MIERTYRPKCLTLNRKNNEMDNHNTSDPPLCISEENNPKRENLITVEATKSYAKIDISQYKQVKNILC